MFQRIKTHLIALVHKPSVRILTPAIAGFLAYGTWGCIANADYDSHVWIKAGLVQGTISFFTNLGIASLMEGLYKAFGNKWLTVGITIPSIIGSAYTVHSLAGTPEILLTIAPAATVGSVYVYGYVSTLAMINRVKLVQQRSTGSS